MIASTPVIRRASSSREFLKLYLTSDPAANSWELSFDFGATWLEGEPVPGAADWYRWLVAGSQAPLGEAVIQLEDGEYILLARATDLPELVVRTVAVLNIDDSPANTDVLPGAVTSPGGTSGPVHGNGFPTGTPALGTEYIDDDETSGAVKWIYATTGWRVTYGDTGWRDIKALFTNTTASGIIAIRRTTEGVTVRVQHVVQSVFEDPLIAILPDGWEVALGVVEGSPYGYAHDYLDGAVAGHIGIGGDVASTTGPNRLHIRVGSGFRDIKAGSLTYHPDDAHPWPSTLPGTVA